MVANNPIQWHVNRGTKNSGIITRMENPASIVPRDSETVIHDRKEKMEEEKRQVQKSQYALMDSVCIEPPSD